MKKNHRCPMCGQYTAHGGDVPVDDLPSDLDAGLAKVKFETKHGQRIGWWYKEDQEHIPGWISEEGLRRDPPYKGIIVARNDTRVSHGIGSSIDIEQCVVVVDTYPVEKCYCVSGWAMLGWLLDNDDIVEVVELAWPVEGKDGARSVQICEHGIRDGNWCEDCNRDYKDAAKLARGGGE